jgi:hypothetical protein
VQCFTASSLGLRRHHHGGRQVVSTSQERPEDNNATEERTQNMMIGNPFRRSSKKNRVSKTLPSTGSRKKNGDTTHQRFF